MEQLDNLEIVENFEQSRKLENHVKGGEIKIEENVEGGEEVGEAEGGVTETEGKCNKEVIVEIEPAKI